MNDKKLMVWTCKIIIEGDELPPGFDNSPRMAAEAAIAGAGFNILMNSSGWGGELDGGDIRYLEENGYNRGSDTYHAGLVDISEDTAH